MFPSIMDHGIGTGKYKINSTIKDVNLQLITGQGNGNEIWSKTDVAYGCGIAVDSACNVYCAHNVSSGDKAIRKLDSNGNEIWSKTDVAYGYGIAVDSACNVYCAHYVNSGDKAIRKLDSATYYKIIN